MNPYWSRRQSAASRATPAQILSGVVLEMDGARVVQASGAVQTWLGAGTPDITQATSANRAAYNASDAGFNGQPVTTFVSDGGTNNNFYPLPDLSALTQGEVFAVLSSQYSVIGYPSDKYTGLWRLGSDTQNVHVPYTNGHVYDSFGSTLRKDYGDMSAYAFTSPHVYNVSSAGGDYTARFNGTTMFTTASNTAGFPSDGIFGYWSSAYAFNGKLAYLVVCNQVQTPAARAKMNRYLAKRFSIAVV